MEHNRKQKLVMIIALIAGIASLSIGFAAFSTTLNISSSANVSPNSDTFSVKFSTSQNSLVVNSVLPSAVADGVTASNGIIDNSTNPTITNLTANFTKGFQYVNYTFYARNEGEYNAYLNGVYYIGDNVCVPEEGTSASLVDSACDDFHILVTVGNKQYSDTSTVTGHVLEKGKGEVIVVRIEYASGGTSVDGPFSVTFPDISLIYSTVDDSSIKPDVTRVVSGDINTVGSVVAIGNEEFYVFGYENNNVKLLSMMNITLDDNPIQSLNAGTTTMVDDYGDYSESVAKEYVDSYAIYLEECGGDIEEARLITEEELIALGCNTGQRTCSDAPNWVYSTTYWSSSCYGTIGDFLVVSSDKNFVGYDGMSYYYGVRPVILIPLSEFE